MAMLRWTAEPSQATGPRQRRGGAAGEAAASVAAVRGGASTW
jgi:hypothetical protein